jgi:hypothetical protein
VLAPPSRLAFMHAILSAKQSILLTTCSSPSGPHLPFQKLHVWIRTDTRSQTYKDRTGATYEGLNQLIKDTGGKHKDLVVGNSQGYYEYGLGFSGDDWKKKTNADGAKITDYAGEYVEVTDDKTHQSVESYEYMGQVKDKKTTLDDIKKIGKYLSVQHHMLRG